MGTLSDPIVGIDLGTSNAVVAHADGAGPARVLADDVGAKIHPSVGGMPQQDVAASRDRLQQLRR
ncbi:MAG TPA: Hsp70 family protein [Kofleriaceae bacterium]|nr:Hsp70 family protein [Kofleriaceae bacterium]